MNTLKKYGLSVCMFATIVFLTGCSGKTTPTPSVSKAGTEVVVSMDNSTFSPATTTIKEGTTIVWTNTDSIAHTVFASGVFDMIPLQPGESFYYTFKKTGTFDYVSTLQKDMIGKIIVE